MKRLAFVVGVLGFLLGVTTASAQIASDGEDGRFTMHRAGEGYLRLDSRTGHVSYCTRRAVGWACQAVPDERGSLEAEIARLQAENVALKKDLLSRNLPLPGGATPLPAPAPKSDEPRLRLPTDADVDRVVSFLERVWRRLVEMMVNIQNDVMRKT